MKVLNLYAGIGGNRKLWQDVEVTAVELDPDIAKIYQDFFPDDKVVVGDAHQYLLDHYKEFDFIWSSPPCQSHSGVNHFLNAQGVVRYPDMKLYEEIIFLDTFFKGKYVVENVKPYYEPLIKAKEIGRHLFWSNFTIGYFKDNSIHMGRLAPSRNGDGQARTENKDTNRIFNLTDAKGVNKYQITNNCANPESSLYILNCARNIITKQNEKQIDLFQ